MSGEKDKFAGSPVIVVWHRAVIEAARTIAQLPPEHLVGLKVRSGEHLAAILITTFLRVAPSGIETDGDVDLRFTMPDGPRFPLLPHSAKEVAFEIKSMPGPFRKFDDSMDTIKAGGGDPFGSTFEVQVDRADDILSDAKPLLQRARHGLLKKTSDETSRNIFLVIHMFDRLAAETIESPAISAALAPPDLEPDIDTLWVLWVPDHLTVWSTKRLTWTDLIFTAANHDEVASAAPGGLTVLQEAESEFLPAIGHRTGSPYLFGLTAGNGD